MEVSQARQHTPRRIGIAEVREHVHGSGRIGKINAWLAVKITKIVGSMWCAYAFAALALVSLPSALRSGDTVIIVSWVSQTFIQLVLLSVIIVGQNVQAAASEGRSENDHETLVAVHTLSVEIHKIDEQQTEILKRLEAKG